MGRGLGATGWAALCLALLGCGEPTDGERWWKGNLHVHSFWSPDGDEFPEMVAEWYKSRGYHFVGISDHNQTMQGDRWLRVATVQRRTRGQGLPGYVERFGRDGVELRGEGGLQRVRLKTLDEVKDLSDEPGRFLVIPSEEVTTGRGDGSAHINVSNLRQRILPPEEEDLVARVRAVLARARAQEGDGKGPVLVSLSHPRWKWAIGPREMAAMEGLHLFEVFNYSRWMRGDEEHLSVEETWDVANAIRLGELGQPPFFGLAADDAHHFRREGNTRPGSAWIMVRAPELTAAAIVTAIRRGRFYATTGVEVDHITFHPGRRELVVDIRPQPGARFTTRFFGARAGAPPEKAGEVLATVDGLQPRYRLRGDELYVRAVVTSSRPVERPLFAGQREQAWLPPVGWEAHVGPASPVGRE